MGEFGLKARVVPAMKNYITWPPGGASTAGIRVLGGSPVGAELEAASLKEGGRVPVVRPPKFSAPEAARCDMLNLLARESHLGLEVNLAAAKGAGSAVSSSFLALARDRVRIVENP
jgi:hypothetical protein